MTRRSRCSIVAIRAFSTGSVAQGEDLAIGFDPWLITEAQLEGWKKKTATQNITWRAVSNLIDGIWKDQPTPPSGEVELHDEELAGASYASKRSAVLEEMKKHGADGVVLTQPDGINWLLNIRGDDVPFNPLLLAYMLVRADGSAMLFTHPHTLSAEVTAYLKNAEG